MSEELILSIDCGTQSLRAIAFDRSGNIQAKSQIQYQPFVQPEPGYCEQDANLYWHSLIDACQSLWRQGIHEQRIVAMSVTTQRSSMVAVDKLGEPLAPAVLWMDQRKATSLKSMGFVWSTLFSMLGVRKIVRHFREKALSNWLKNNNPSLHSKTSHWLFLSGFLNKKLTGQFKDSVASQVGYAPFDYKHQQWASPMDWKWQALSIKPDQLPELVESGKVIANLTPEAMKQLGFSNPIPVFASGADKACEVLGSGGVSDDFICLSFGTTATVNICHTHYKEAVRHMPAYPAVLPHHFCFEVMLYRGFWMVTWFKEQFGFLEQQRAKETNKMAEVFFDDLVNAVPPGSLGLMLQPYWGAGVREPGPEAKGAVIGFGDVHKREHLYRAILEGLNFGLREGFEKIQKRCKVNPTRLRVSGGGSQSNAAMQIAADIFGMPAERPHTNETSGLGAAIAVAAGLGWYKDMIEASEHMIHVKDVFLPNVEHQQKYDTLYKEIYLKMYHKLRPLYQRIQAITGYPE